ncbi:MAG TPA: DUF362 domain-containing protein, partial [Proteobacteria bacterium]|nr:DUF362 domain-containing protein [Pseudomonadota bacterium]
MVEAAVSKVWWIDFRARPNRSVLDKLEALLAEAGVGDVVSPKSLVALKIHFGERGTTAYIRPVFVRRVVDVVRKLGGRPFLTDASTLYRGDRDVAPTHIECAFENGFDYTSVGAPIVIADGLKGTTDIKVEVNLKHFDEVSIG